ncbi:MAG: hypothetical protein ACTSRP_09355 [Candidatus Helarchaeota archaeon]
MEKILKDMEERITALKNLENLMKNMTNTLRKFKEDIASMEFDVNAAKLDAWTRNVFNYIIEIGREDGLSVVESVDEIIPRVYINMEEVKKGLLDRGISMEPKSEPIVQKFLNEMISLGLDFIVSKELAREKYRQFEKELREKLQKIKAI